MSYSYRYKAIWFRNYKVASRTINNYLTSDSKPGSLIYGSAMPYSQMGRQELSISSPSYATLKKNSSVVGRTR